MLKEYFLMAFRSLFSHKARSFLTMLGIIIGVSSVVLLISLGNSAKAEAVNQIRGLGSNLVLIQVRDPQGYLPKVWLDELSDKADISMYSPVVSGSASYTVNGSDFTAGIYGVNSRYDEISSLELASGRFFTGVDAENGAAVAVVGQKVENALFADTGALGRTLVIKGLPFKVIGVLAKQGTSFSGDMDKAVYIPVTFADTFASATGARVYYASSENEETITNTVSKLEGYLKRSMPSDRMYTVFSQSQMLDMLDTIMGLLTNLLAGIAAISLVVGGIGIMNIMLVTVRERTKEIGVRKALGARRSHILFQFLFEAVILTIIGGLIGLGISVAGAWVLSSLTDFAVTVGFDSVILAVTFSAAVGIIFGIYPANKAGKLEPVEALRFE